ncbi:MAG TPA: hypothetical protein VG759_15155 [Candidatus Angelobacter sp.]|jgi:hypothetical protein|nr:hypothetical protein [Candidatus Angelobacter sp.]
MGLVIAQVMGWLFEKLLIDPSSTLIKRWRRKKLLAGAHGFVLAYIQNATVDPLDHKHSLKMSCSYEIKHDFYSTELEYWNCPKDSDEAQALAKFLTGQRIVIRVSEADPEKALCLQEDQERSAVLGQMKEHDSISHAK